MRSKTLLTAITGFIILVCSLNSAIAQKSESKVGIGFMLGEPTGISLKAWTSGTTAFDAGLAWSFGRYDAINIHADHLWHNFNAFSEVEKGQLPLYYGIGGRVVLAENDAVLGARVPIGLNYLIEDSPVGLFFEIAPIFNVIPATDFDLDGAIGVRFYL